MKRICFVIPSLHAGGMERVMSEIIDYAVVRNEFEIHLILYGINRDIFFNLPNRVTIHRPLFKFNNKHRIFYTIRTLLFLRKTLRILKPHALLSFGELWNNLVLLSTLGLGLKVYVSDRCQPDKSLGKFHDRLRRILYPHANAVIAQTFKAQDIYSSQFKAITYVIGNPIRQIESDERDRENIVLSVGRLIDTKHHDRLIKIFLKIWQPGWKLVIVGDDALKQNRSEILKKMIVSSGAEDKIILAGKQHDVDSYYSKSKVFAFTSSSEGFPNVVGEAMAAGLPVVAYDCIAGPSEMITDGINGYLVPVFDDELFGERLQFLMADERSRTQMGMQARIDIRKLDKQLICEKFYSVITA